MAVEYIRTERAYKEGIADVNFWGSGSPVVLQLQYVQKTVYVVVL